MTNTLEKLKAVRDDAADLLMVATGGFQVDTLNRMKNTLDTLIAELEECSTCGERVNELCSNSFHLRTALVEILVTHFMANHPYFNAALGKTNMKTLLSETIAIAFQHTREPGVEAGARAMQQTFEPRFAKEDFETLPANIKRMYRDAAQACIAAAWKGEGK